MDFREKKYVMIITAEDERYDRGEAGLDFFSNHPWEGVLENILIGNNFEELYNDGSCEGLFFQLYSTDSGKCISRGTLDPNSPKEEIEEFEKGELK